MVPSDSLYRLMEPVSCFSSSPNMWMACNCAAEAGKLEFGDLNELLIAAVQQPGNLALDQGSRTNGKGRRRVTGLGGNQHRRGPMLAYQHAACDLGVGYNIKRMGAQKLQRLVKVWVAGFSGHVAVHSAKKLGYISA